MIRSTFQLVAGIGPKKERLLWDAGVRCWDDLDLSAPPAALARDLVPKLRGALEEARGALAANDAERLAALVPGRERWRLFEAFSDEAVYLDIETEHDEGITAIGLLDARGPRILLGRELDRFPEEVSGARVLVTFNGRSFDVPVLRRRFPDWTPPRAHIDLRHVWWRLGHRGGLKALEDQQGIGRPLHLRGLNGSLAVGLWRRAQWGDVRALRLFAEYNLYDTVNLRTLMALAYNQLVARAGLGAPEVPVSHRGDVLYDVTRELLRVAPQPA